MAKDLLWHKGWSCSVNKYITTFQYSSRRKNNTEGVREKRRRSSIKENERQRQEEMEMERENNQRKEEDKQGFGCRGRFVEEPGLTWMFLMLSNENPKKCPVLKMDLMKS